MATTGFRTMHVPRVYAVAGTAYGGTVLALYTRGIYHYRSHDLPLFVPPGHGLVYLTGLAVARIVGERRIVSAAAVGSAGWGLAGLTLLPRLDVAGGLGVAVLGTCLWRSRAGRPAATRLRSTPRNKPIQPHTFEPPHGSDGTAGHPLGR